MTDLYNFGWAQMGQMGLTITSRSVKWEKWAADLNILLTLENATQWAIGDMYLYGDNQFTYKDASQALSGRRVRLKTIQNYAWVCGRFERGEIKIEYIDGVAVETNGQRWFPPSFSHHSVIAKLVPARRRYWQELIIKDHLNVAELTDLTAIERGIIEPAYDPLRVLFNSYNNAVQAYKQIPDEFDEDRNQIMKGLKTIEEALVSLEKKMGIKEAA